MSHNSSAGHSPPSGHHRESPSPPPRGSRHRDGGWQVVIKRVIEKSIEGIVYPMLMHTNYTKWSDVMCFNLQAAGCGKQSTKMASSTTTTAMHWQHYSELFPLTWKLG
jgi:hypothetical protein